MKWTIILGMVMVLALAACTPGTIVVEQPGVETQSNTINVQGSSDFEVAPDEAEIMFRIESRGKNAQLAQDDNRKTANSVKTALMGAGILPTMMETTDYNVHRETRWDRKTEQQIEVGYVVSHTMKVKTTNLEGVGRVLDAGIQAGANNVQNIRFMLSDKEEAKAKEEALRQSANNAHEKAKALADGLNVRLGSLRKVTENTFHVQPFERYGVMEMSAAMDEAAPTPITPSSVKVSAQVSVTYNIG